jgi:hypothetical protein
MAFCASQKSHFFKNGQKRPNLALQARQKFFRPEHPQKGQICEIWPEKRPDGSRGARTQAFGEKMSRILCYIQALQLKCTWKISIKVLGRMLH